MNQNYKKSLFDAICITKGAPIDERIIGGELANLGDFPYLVSLTENSRHFCSGFIYSETWVVTTAKCVSGFVDFINRI